MSLGLKVISQDHCCPPGPTSTNLFFCHMLYMVGKFAIYFILLMIFCILWWKIILLWILNSCFWHSITSPVEGKLSRCSETAGLLWPDFVMAEPLGKPVLIKVVWVRTALFHICIISTLIFKYYLYEPLVIGGVRLLTSPHIEYWGSF